MIVDRLINATKSKFQAEFARLARDLRHATLQQVFAAAAQPIANRHRLTQDQHRHLDTLAESRGRQRKEPWSQQSWPRHGEHDRIRRHGHSSIAQSQFDVGSHHDTASDCRGTVRQRRMQDTIEHVPANRLRIAANFGFDIRTSQLTFIGTGQFAREPERSARVRATAGGDHQMMHGPAFIPQVHDHHGARDARQDFAADAGSPRVRSIHLAQQDHKQVRGSLADGRQHFALVFYIRKTQRALDAMLRGLAHQLVDEHKQLVLRNQRLHLLLEDLWGPRRARLRQQHRQAPLASAREPHRPCHLQGDRALRIQQHHNRHRVAR
jgi:hypothetical protein